MKVTLKTITPNIEENIVEIARVSSSRTDKTVEGDRLINYLIKNNHWSPFEHGFLTFEVHTSKAIGIQLLRHRSNFFQEFSQRYQDVRVLENVLEPIELRQQAVKNRQSSTEVFDPLLDNVPILGKRKASDAISSYLQAGLKLYGELLDKNVAKECARMILPMCTSTKMYITMNVRSVIHWLDLRDDEHAQKEIREIAQRVKEIVIEHLPIISKARGYE
jgi:thymidylate synthase (FAD)